MCMLIYRIISIGIWSVTDGVLWTRTERLGRDDGGKGDTDAARAG